MEKLETGKERLPPQPPEGREVGLTPVLQVAPVRRLAAEQCVDQDPVEEEEVILQRNLEEPVEDVPEEPKGLSGEHQKRLGPVQQEVPPEAQGPTGEERRGPSGEPAQEPRAGPGPEHQPPADVPPRPHLVLGRLVEPPQTVLLLAGLRLALLPRLMVVVVLEEAVRLPPPRAGEGRWRRRLGGRVLRRAPRRLLAVVRGVPVARATGHQAAARRVVGLKRRRPSGADAPTQDASVRRAGGADPTPRRDPLVEARPRRGAPPRSPCVRARCLATDVGDAPLFVILHH